MLRCVDWLADPDAFEGIFISVNRATECNIMEDLYPHFLICSKRGLI